MYLNIADPARGFPSVPASLSHRSRSLLRRCPRSSQPLPGDTKLFPMLNIKYNPQACLAVVSRIHILEVTAMLIASFYPFKTEGKVIVFNQISNLFGGKRLYSNKIQDSIKLSQIEPVSEDIYWQESVITDHVHKRAALSCISVYSEYSPVDCRKC